jgi:hypothetical protein
VSPLNDDDRSNLKFIGLFLLVLSISLIVDPFEEGPFDVCIFKNATNLPCPGCGLTRSFIYAGHLHLEDSVRMHPFGLVLFLFWGYVSVKDAVWIFWGKKLPFFAPGVWSRLKTVFLVTLVAFGVVRMLFYLDEFSPLLPLQRLFDYARSLI